MLQSILQSLLPGVHVKKKTLQTFEYTGNIGNSYNKNDDLNQHWKGCSKNIQKTVKTMFFFQIYIYKINNHHF